MDYPVIQTVFCEDPWQKMWDQFLFFETEPTVRKYLGERYKSFNEAEKRAAVYRNTPKIIYLSKQAREFFFSGKNSSPLVQPLLYYYGMVNLAKMVILSLDPFYPSHTTLLAHGVTTRKIKKSQYLFLEDEVKVQKEGLLPHLIQLLQGEVCRDSFQMGELISIIPELSHIYTRLYNKEELIPIQVLNDWETNQSVAIFPTNLLNHKDGDIKQICEWLNHYNYGKGIFYPMDIDIEEKVSRGPWGKPPSFSLYWSHPDGVCIQDTSHGFENRLFFQDLLGRNYLWLNPKEKLMIPELMVYFLIMYLLSILCRYEGDLWGELHFSFYSQDLYLIHEFLQLAPRKYPNLILNQLFNSTIYFQRQP